jgi:hypothetical protein
MSMGLQGFWVPVSSSWWNSHCCEGLKKIGAVSGVST